MAKTVVATAVVLLAGVSGCFAADRLIEAGSLSPANNGAAIAAVKAENSTNFGAAADAANAQLGNRDDASALGAGKAIGSHAYSASADEGAVKKGVLNVHVDTGSLAADPKINSAKVTLGAESAAQTLGGREAAN